VALRGAPGACSGGMFREGSRHAEPAGVVLSDGLRPQGASGRRLRSEGETCRGGLSPVHLEDKPLPFRHDAEAGTAEA
jgi:hypothetical protein